MLGFESRKGIRNFEKDRNALRNLRAAPYNSIRTNRIRTICTGKLGVCVIYFNKNLECVGIQKKHRSRARFELVSAFDQPRYTRCAGTGRER